MQLHQYCYGITSSCMWLVIGILAVYINVASTSSQALNVYPMDAMANRHSHLARLLFANRMKRSKGNGPCGTGNKGDVGCPCTTNANCATNICHQGKCKANTCFDGHRNKHETDVDCGGVDCIKCGNDKACQGASDCTSGVCTSSICQAPTCYDSVKNQDESDVDCGGSSCDKCSDGKTCQGSSDCTSGVCTSNICQVPTCSDGVKNQDETDIDCGGASCNKCLNGKACRGSSDCTSGVCTSNICQVPTCYDSVKNQDESDVDCGGLVCSHCTVGKTCNTGSDCSTGTCESGFCINPPPTCTTCLNRDGFYYYYNGGYRFNNGTYSISVGNLRGSYTFTGGYYTYYFNVTTRIHYDRTCDALCRSLNSYNNGYNCNVIRSGACNFAPSGPYTPSSNIQYNNVPTTFNFFDCVGGGTCCCSRS